MHLFNRAFKHPEPEAVVAPAVIARPERRHTQRHVVNPKTPIKAVLSFIGRDETGTRLSSSRFGWDWKGQLVDFSERGASMQLGAAALAAKGDAGELKLTLRDTVLEIPCLISNIRVQAEGLIYGLQFGDLDEATWAAYRRVLDILALGIRLKPQYKKTKPDETGYFVEQYVSDRQSRLTIWRNQDDRSVAAFEFQLKDNLVRGAERFAVVYLSGADPATARRAPPARATEIQQLFHWVVPNLAKCVPADVRDFLQRFVA
jgi:hypothetical protein